MTATVDLVALSVDAIEAIEAHNDVRLTLQWLQVYAADAFMDAPRAKREAMYRTVITLCADPQLTSADRISRLRTAASIAGFLEWAH